MITDRILATTILLMGCAVGIFLANERVPSATDDIGLVARQAATVPPFVTPAFGEVLRETVTVAADRPIVNVPGKRFISLIVDYPPGARSAPHRHAQSAFIYALVLSGEIRSQVDSEPPQVYRQGESWFENPGAHHAVSENASETEAAKLLAVFIVDKDDDVHTVPDHQ